MKNFIFCHMWLFNDVFGFVERAGIKCGISKCEYVNPSVDVGLPDIQFITLETAPADCVATDRDASHVFWLHVTRL